MNIKSWLLLLKSWVEINTYSHNIAGINQCLTLLEQSFAVLGGTMERLPLDSAKKSGQVLSIKKHPKAQLKILLVGHIDTVFPENGSFQKLTTLDDTHVQGPGVIDMKGGLLILLKSLEILEQSEFAGAIGWEVLITPDEEIGSIASKKLLEEKAKYFDFALVFEPCLPNGSLVNERKGSINYTVTAKGKKAHVGRDFQKGENAILKLIGFIQSLNSLNDLSSGFYINVGHIEGGTSANVVPDIASCKVNIRYTKEEQFFNLQKRLDELTQSDLEIQLTSHRPPKPFDLKNQKLFNLFLKTSLELGIDIQWESSGGVCDGNILSACGLGCIDTLGALGKNMHTHEEQLYIPSLQEKVNLVSHFLIKLAKEPSLFKG